MKMKSMAAVLCLLLLLGMFPAGALADGTVTITFDPCGGAGTMEARTVPEGVAFQVPRSEFAAPEGTVFGYWVCDGKGWYPGSTVSAATEDMALEARWIHYEDTYVNRVVWLDCDGMILDSRDYAEGEPEPSTDVTPALAANSRYSFTFTGWVESEGGGGGRGTGSRGGFPVSGGGGIVTERRTIVQNVTTYEPAFRAVPTGGGAAVDDVRGAGEDGGIFWLLTGDAALTIGGTGSVDSLPLENRVLSVEVQDGVTGLGDALFSYRDQLRAVTIPASVTAVGQEAFAGCWNLVNVFYIGTRARWESLAAGGVADGNDAFLNATVHCVDGTLNLQYDAEFHLDYWDSGTYVAEVTCTDMDAVVFCAAYAADGQMVSCGVQPPSATGKVEFPFETGTFDELRVFVADGNGKPLYRHDSTGAVWRGGSGGGGRAVR